MVATCKPGSNRHHRNPKETLVALCFGLLFAHTCRTFLLPTCCREHRQYRGFRGGVICSGASSMAWKRVSLVALNAAWVGDKKLVQTGDLLLAQPGGVFAISQQQFHKAVILIVQHQEDRGRAGPATIGLMLNRPTEITNVDLPANLEANCTFSGRSAFKADSVSLQRSTGQPLSLRYGGDCSGLESMSHAHTKKVFASVLHQKEQFKNMSTLVANGIYRIGWTEACKQVIDGRASYGDFLWFFGFCGWGRGQLERELESGQVWQSASASDLDAVNISSNSVLHRMQTADDSIQAWQQLYSDLRLADERPNDWWLRLQDSIADSGFRNWERSNLFRLP